jgi:hypothetical protein
LKGSKNLEIIFLKKKQIGKSINMLQSDRGGEYFTKNFKIM